MLIQINKTTFEFEIFYTTVQEESQTALPIYHTLKFHPGCEGFKGVLLVGPSSRLRPIVYRFMVDFNLFSVENKTHFFLYDDLFARLNFKFPHSAELNSDGNIVFNFHVNV